MGMLLNDGMDLGNGIVEVESTRLGGVGVMVSFVIT
jgi:hypothetical protein